MSERYQALLSNLKQNRDAGSVQLALTTLRDLYHYLDSKSELTLKRLEDIATELKSSRVTMVVIANAIERWQRLWPDNHADFKQQYLNALQTIINELSAASQQIAEHALELIKPGMSILTHSRSSQVMKLFELVQRKRINIHVYQTISAPGNEGFLAAKELDKLGIPVTLITDAEIGLVMPKMDLVLSGCDNWLADHHFVNKTGTLFMALAADLYRKPIWVLADSFKNSHDRHDVVQLETMPVYELHLPQGQHIDGLNTYFETIPTRLLTGRVDEHALQPLL